MDRAHNEIDVDTILFIVTVEEEEKEKDRGGGNGVEYTDPDRCKRQKWKSTSLPNFLLSFFLFCFCIILMRQECASKSGQGRRVAPSSPLYLIIILNIVQNIDPQDSLE